MDTTQEGALSAGRPTFPADSSALPRAVKNEITDQCIRSCIDDFRIGRAQKGVAESDEEFFVPLLNRWCAVLRRPPGTRSADITDTKFLVRFATCLHESMGMRDAIILSVVSALGQPDLLRVGVNPNDPATAQLVSSTLSAIFRERSAIPDKQKCQNGLDALIETHTQIPRRYSAQPLAVLAYLLWWSGRSEEAQGAALRSLSVDGECTLAAIVLSAVEYDIAPAWVQAALSEAADDTEESSDGE